MLRPMHPRIGREMRRPEFPRRTYSTLVASRELGRLAGALNLRAILPLMVDDSAR